MAARKNWKVPLKFLEALLDLYNTLNEAVLLKEKQIRFFNIKGLKSFNNKLWSESKEKQYHKKLLKLMKVLDKSSPLANSNVKKAGMDDRETVIAAYKEEIDKCRDNIQKAKNENYFPWSFLRYENHASIGYMKLLQLD
jgi:hypothetical protein